MCGECPLQVVEFLVEAPLEVALDAGEASVEMQFRLPPGTTAAGVREVPVVETFADVDKHDPLVTVGSHGFVECDANQGRGDEAFDLAPGRAVTLSFEEAVAATVPTA